MFRKALLRLAEDFSENLGAERLFQFVKILSVRSLGELPHLTLASKLE
jgi:hypothetical protein